MASETEPFLGDFELKERRRSWATKERPLKAILYPLTLHSALIIAYTAAFFLAFHFESRCADPPTSLHRNAFHSLSSVNPADLLAAISNLTFRYVPMSYTDFEISPFAGPPSPAVDKAWHDLLAKTAIRVHGSELQNSNQTSIALPAGGGFMAWLGVYHQLHCIVRLARFVSKTEGCANLLAENAPSVELSRTLSPWAQGR